MTVASYGGAEIFGSEVRMKLHWNPLDFRDRGFIVDGTLVAKDIPSLLELERNMMSFADGVPRDLVMPYGYTVFNVMFRGEYLPDPEGPHWTGGNIRLPYQAVFRL